MTIAIVVGVLAVVVAGLIWHMLSKARVLDRNAPLTEAPRRDAEPIAARLDKLVDDLRKVGDEGAAIRDQYKGAS